MSDSDRIDAVIEALERLVAAERARRDERDKQREELKASMKRKPQELAEGIPKIDVNKIEQAQADVRAKAESWRLEAIEREERHFALLERQTELLEAIANRLEGKR